MDDQTFVFYSSARHNLGKKETNETKGGDVAYRLQRRLAEGGCRASVRPRFELDEVEH